MKKAWLGCKHRFFVFCLFVCFCPGRAAGGILVPRAGIEPVTPAMETGSLNHWTATEVPKHRFFALTLV